MVQPTKPDASLEPKNVNQLAYKIEMQLSKLMEQYLKRYENEHKKKLNEFLAARWDIQFFSFFETHFNPNYYFPVKLRIGNCETLFSKCLTSM